MKDWSITKIDIMKNIPLLKQVSSKALLKNAICPNCWHGFPPEELRSVSVHPESDSEPQLPSYATGKRELLRFKPERFDPQGRAMDFRGLSANEVACPKCKLTLPRESVELEPIILSVLGTKASGKSVFIASMVYAMRQRAGTLGISFQDACLQLNTSLLEDERRLFLSSNADKYRSFGDVVQATQVEDHGSWRRSIVDGLERRYLPPYTFRIAPTAAHPRASFKGMERMLCLYDNAGEHFDYRTTLENKFMTGHLAKSSGIMFTFDPTQDRRFAKLIRAGSSIASDGIRQDTFLLEAANRIRENSHVPLAARDQIPQSIVVVLTKFDMWKHALDGKIPENLYETVTGSKFNCIVTKDIQTVSAACRQLLVQNNCREIVETAESISRDVIFCPVASVGTDIKKDKFRISAKGPVWSEIPMLWLLNRVHPALFPTCKRMKSKLNSSTGI